MGGKAVKDVRPLTWDEVKPTYEWVENNILPLILLTKEDAIPIGSYGKKAKGETSGDIDIAINAKKFEPLQFEDIAVAIDCVLNEENGFETTLLKGFDQVSVKVPICGDESKGYAQIDLMPSPDLKWAKFMYHSPNLAEGESKYKGAVRNALLMALISESTKEVTKLYEGKAEEYKSLAIRFPTGVWDIKRSFMGKSGKIVQKGAVLESEFVTREPQDVIDIALGEGYGIGAANSFETLWEIIHRKDFIHKHKLNEIMSKFLVNLKSMKQNTPEEAVKKYPTILGEALSDVLKPKTEDELASSIDNIMNEPKPSFYSIKKLHEKGLLKNYPKEKIRTAINKSEIPTWRIKEELKWLKYYLTKEEIDSFKFKEELSSYERNLKRYSKDISRPTNRKELRSLEKEAKFNKDKRWFNETIEIIKEGSYYKSIAKIIRDKINKNQFRFIFEMYQLSKDHKNSHYTHAFMRRANKIVQDVIPSMARSEFKVPQGNQWGLQFIDKLVNLGFFKIEKEKTKQFVVLNRSYKDSEEFITQNYYKLMRDLTDEIENFNVPGLYEGKNEVNKG